MLRHPTGADVRGLRERTGLTQAAFGRLVYRSMRIVQDWEADKRYIPLDTWEYLHLLHEVPVVRRWRQNFLRRRRKVRT